MASRKKSKKSRRSSRFRKGGSRIKGGSRKKLPAVYGHVMSPSCPACIDLQPAWKRLTENLHQPPHDISDDYDNRVEQFNKQYNTKLEFNGYPTIFKVKSIGQPVQYYDDFRSQLPPRSTESIQQWLYI